MTPITTGALIGAAHRRATVTLEDGRTARVVFAPGRRSRRGRRVLVQLPSGAFLTVPLERIVEVAP